MQCICIFRYAKLDINKFIAPKIKLNKIKIEFSWGFYCPINPWFRSSIFMTKILTFCYSKFWLSKEPTRNTPNAGFYSKHGILSKTALKAGIVFI